MTPAEATLNRVIELMTGVMDHLPSNEERYADEEHRLMHGYLQCVDQELKEYVTRTDLHKSDDTHEMLTFDVQSDDVRDQLIGQSASTVLLDEETDWPGDILHTEGAAEDKAMRFNSGKPQISMVLSAYPALEGVARVLEFGAKKYDRDNWKKGLDLDEVLDSMLRHIGKYLNGEYYDLNPETGLADENYSGLPHIDHIGCNALFLGYHTNRETEDGRNPQEKCCGGNCDGCPN
jgi:hypothetical protein